MFFDRSRKNWSFPFSLSLKEEDAINLGLVSSNNVDSYSKKIPGKFIYFNDFTEAYLQINRIRNNVAELTLFAGPEILEVYSKNLRSLPWPIITAPTTLIAHALQISGQSYPTTNHVFGSIYRPDIKNEKNYEEFVSYVNNFNGTEYIENVFFGASPERLGFNYVQTGPAPPTQQLQITCSGSWELASSVGWITLGATSGSGDTLVNIDVDASGLSAAVFSGFLTATSGDVEIRIPVSLGVSGSSGTPSNQVEGSPAVDPDAPKAYNLNVMAPCVHLLEVVRFIYLQENKTAVGPFMESDFFKRLVLIPDRYFTNFDPDTFQAWSFDFFTEQTPFGVDEVVNLYKKSIDLTSAGTYILKVNISFPKSMAYRFFYSAKAVVAGGGGATDIFAAAGTFDQAVLIDEEIEINVPEDAYYTTLEIELGLSQTTIDISPFNAWEFSYKGGPLNVFPGSYTLSDFVPDLSSKDFLDRIKTYFNLKFDITENLARISFIDQVLPELEFKDLRTEEIKGPTRDIVQNTVFKLTLLDGSELIVDKDGISFNLTNINEQDITKIEIQVLPVKISDELDRITANYPEEDTEIMLAIYDGLQDGDPLFVDNYQAETLELTSIYERLWKLWLKFRTNSEIYKDKFVIHISREISLDQGLYKYNKLHVIKRLKKRMTSSQFVEIEIEAETL